MRNVYDKVCGPMSLGQAAWPRVWSGVWGRVLDHVRDLVWGIR